MEKEDDLCLKKSGTLVQMRRKEKCTFCISLLVAAVDSWQYCGAKRFSFNFHDCLSPLSVSCESSYPCDSEQSREEFLLVAVLCISLFSVCSHRLLKSHVTWCFFKWCFFRECSFKTAVFLVILLLVVLVSFLPEESYLYHLKYVYLPSFFFTFFLRNCISEGKHDQCLQLSTLHLFVSSRCCL